MMRVLSSAYTAFVLAALLVASNARAQTPCEEPQEDRYRTLMETARATIDQGRYEDALGQLQYARQSYDPAVLDFSIARALHQLERYDEAVEAYNLFLRRFEGCPDPDELAAAARHYRTLAVEQQAWAIERQTDEGSSGSPLNPGWIISGCSVALVLAGVGFDLANLDLDNDLQRAYDRNDVDSALDLEDEREQARVIDAVLYGAGLIGVVTGALFLLLWGEGGDDGALPSTVSFRRMDAVWTLEVRF